MFTELGPRSQRRSIVVCFLLTVSICVVGVSAVSASFVEIGAQITPIDDQPETDPPGLGNIVGSPEAGPDPEDPGDRGGWAQLGLAVVIMFGVGFIASRIIKDSRKSRTSNISPNETL